MYEPHALEKGGGSAEADVFLGAEREVIGLALCDGVVGAGVAHPGKSIAVAARGRGWYVVLWRVVRALCQRLGRVGHVGENR